jgi:hypothetical protein
MLRKLRKHILDWVASERIKLIEIHEHIYAHSSFITVFILNQLTLQSL